MVRVKFTLSIGYQGKHEDIMEYLESEFEGMDQEQIDQFLESEYQDWCANYIDGGYHVLDEEDDGE